MPVSITADTRGLRRLKRRLRRVRSKSLLYAAKEAQDEGAKFYRREFQREWNREFDVRRKTFPSRVFRIRWARVSGGRVTATNVREFAGAETIRRQLRGGVRRPRGKFLYVPVNKRARKPKARTFVAGKSVYVRNRRGARRIAGLAASVDVPRRFSHRRVVARVEKRMGRLLKRALVKELRTALRRRGGQSVRR